LRGKLAQQAGARRAWQPARLHTQLKETSVMYVQQQKGALQFLLVAAAALGCSASVLSGALQALSAGTLLA
jgi:hypothetical protein